jgi:hypothetical protein
MPTRHATLLFLFLLASISGCVPSKFPLSDEKTSKIDERLIGTWVITDDSERVALELHAKAGANALEDSEGELLYTTSIGGDHYISEPYTEDGKHMWVICGYEFSKDGDLKVYQLNPAVLAKSIGAGELAGKVKSYRPMFFGFVAPMEQNVEITDKTDQLLHYFARQGRDCWLTDDDSVLTFHRR